MSTLLEKTSNKLVKAFLGNNLISAIPAKFTKKMGALVNKSNLGFGKRSWRYSMVINNGKIEKLFVEGGRINNCPIDPFEVSDADTMIKYLSK